MQFEIYTYDSEDDFELSKYSFLDGCYNSIDRAIAVIESENVLKNYAVAKVQSIDGETTHVFRSMKSWEKYFLRKNN